MYDYLVYLIPVAALLLTLLQVRRKPAQVSKYALAMVLCAFYAIIMMLSSGLSVTMMLFLMGITVISANAVYSYSSHRADFSAALVAILFGFFCWPVLSLSAMPYIEAVAVGSLLAVVLKFGYVQKTEKADKGLEKRRDLFQIIMGVIALSAFMLGGQYSYSIVFLLVLLGYAISGLLTGGRLNHHLRKLERKGSAFGAGAIYMAVGTLLILGSIPDYSYVVVGLVALLICDAIATVIGVHGRHRLPYNRDKTVEGTLAYFVALSVIGFPFISFYALLFAAVLAALESVIQSVDDNIAIPIAVIVLYFIL